MARAAGHEQEDDVLGLGRARRQPCRRPPGGTENRFVHERGQGDCPKTGSRTSEEIAPVREVVVVVARHRAVSAQ